MAPFINFQGLAPDFKLASLTDLLDYAVVLGEYAG